MTWLWWRALAQIRPALLIALNLGLLTELAQTFVPDSRRWIWRSTGAARCCRPLAAPARRRFVSRTQTLAVMVVLLLFHFALSLCCRRTSRACLSHSQQYLNTLPPLLALARRL